MEATSVGETITLKAADGHQFSAYKVTPKGKPKGAIVVIQEIFGVNRHIRGLTDGFAADGYLAIAPGIYDRAQPGVELGYTEADVVTGRELRTKISWDAIIQDVQAAVDAVKSAGKVGITGYCFGGSVVWLAAERVKGLSAAVGYYGGAIAQFADAKIKVPTILHFGAKDPMIPPGDIDKVRKNHPNLPIYVYDADHGFVCDERHHYDAAASKQARERTMAFFAKHLAG